MLTTFCQNFVNILTFVCQTFVKMLIKCCQHFVKFDPKIEQFQTLKPKNEKMSNEPHSSDGKENRSNGARPRPETMQRPKTRRTRRVVRGSPWSIALQLPPSSVQDTRT